MTLQFKISLEECPICKNYSLVKGVYFFKKGSNKYDTVFGNHCINCDYERINTKETNKLIKVFDKFIESYRTFITKPNIKWDTT